MKITFEQMKKIETELNKLGYTTQRHYSITLERNYIQITKYENRTVADSAIWDDGFVDVRSGTTRKKVKEIINEIIGDNNG